MQTGIARITGRQILPPGISYVRRFLVIEWATIYKAKVRRKHHGSVLSLYEFSVLEEGALHIEFGLIGRGRLTLYGSGAPIFVVDDVARFEFPEYPGRVIPLLLLDAVLEDGSYGVVASGLRGLEL